MKNKLDGFTLIELLVTIMIIGILSSVTVASFSSYFGKARDAVRVSDTELMGTTIATFSADKWKASEKYKFVNDATSTTGSTKLSAVFDLDGYKAPRGQNGSCYFFGFYYAANDTYSSKDNTYYVATWGEATSTDAPGTPGLIYSGSSGATDELTKATLTPAHFKCSGGSAIPALSVSGGGGTLTEKKLYIDETGVVK